MKFSRPGQDSRAFRRRRRRFASRSAARNSSRRAGPTAAMAARGGHVLAECADGLNTLIDFRYRQHFKAQRGRHGMGKARTGAAGDDLTVKMPGRHADFRGGPADPGGRSVRRGRSRPARQGAATAAAATSHFKSSGQPRAAAAANRAGPARTRWLWLRLKLIADAGLVGLPNAGKIDLPGAGLAGASEDCRLSVHNPASQSRRGRCRRAPVRAGRPFRG